MDQILTYFNICMSVINALIFVALVYYFTTSTPSTTQPSNTACQGQKDAPVSNACLNEVWKNAGCTTLLPADYSGWWTTKSLAEVKADMAIYGKDNSKTSKQYTTCKGAFV